MAVLHLLGTGAAVSDPDRTTTMLAVERDGRSLVVDCGGDVVQRLLAAGVEVDGIEAMIVTHEHPDHVAGFPLFMEKLWLLGRRRPIPVHGIRPALAQARRLWESFETGGWEGVPEIDWREIDHAPDARVLENERWRVTAAPGTHGVPVVGLRVEDRIGGGVAAYSSDTARSDRIAALARGADLLVHEGARESLGGHTPFAEAAEVAALAEVRRLVLVHLPPGVGEEDLREARRRFPELRLGRDGDRFHF